MIQSHREVMTQVVLSNLTFIAMGMGGLFQSYSSF